MSQDDDTVSVVYRDANGRTSTIGAEYAVGADGAGGITRRSVGIEIERGVELPTNVSITFRATNLDRDAAFPIALHYWVVNPKTQGVLIRLDPDQTWTGWSGASPIPTPIRRG